MPGGEFAGDARLDPAALAPSFVAIEPAVFGGAGAPVERADTGGLLSDFAAAPPPFEDDVAASCFFATPRPFFLLARSASSAAACSACLCL